jgi:hypothetical protein
MNSHAAQPQPVTHENAQLLLPWLRDGTPDDAELAAVRAHVEGCAQCQADIQWQERLRAAVPPADPALDAGRAFASLLPRLGPQAQRLPVLRAWRDALAANSAWLRWTAAAQFAAIGVLAVMLARPAAETGDYRALGAARPAEAALVLMFRPETTEREMRRILQLGGARVVDGPTAAGAWVIALPAAQSATALRRMRAEPAVALAQPLAAGSPP